MAERDRDSWLQDFSFVISRDAIRSTRRGPQFEAYTRSKWAALPWLSFVATISGALGGLAVSGALWSRWWQVPLWLLALLAFAIAARRLTMAAAGQPIGFLSGWCIFFGVLIGAFTMWAAQLDSAGWAYGIAGGAVFFLLGITGGLIEPPNSKHMEDWFMTSSISAPLSSCLATWLYRNALTPPATLEAAALTGALAAFPFLTITMALHLLAWRQERAIKLLAELYLHHDDFTGEAIALLNSAEESEGTEAWLYDRRGLAHALAGDENAAEADWARHAELEPKGTAPDISRGWLALRRDRLEDAASAFERACARRKRDRWAAVGLGITRLRQGNAQAAVEVLKTVKDEAHDALSLTYLAEAYFAAGAAEMAASMATTAIEELDSVHGRSWLVRARALRRLGKIDEAAKDYNKACWAAEEDWVSDAAMAELVEIDRPLTEDEPED